MFLVDILHWARSFCKYMFEFPNYHVTGVYINYTADMIVEQDEIEGVSDIWRSESKTWVGLDGRYFWDITKEFNITNSHVIHDILLFAPPNVKDIVYTIKYSYNNRTYKYVSNSDVFYWPPRPKSMSFRMPILEAWCLDENGNRIRNATKKLKKAAGPVGDFHNQDVQVMDVVDYDYPHLEVTTLLGKKILHESDSVLKI